MAIGTAQGDAVQGIVVRSMARLVQSLADSRPNLLRVLTYHRVDWPEQSAHLEPSTLSASPATFSRQMQCLAREFCPIPIDRVIDALEGRTPLPPRAVLVTFDDAYRDFAANAWPILQAQRIPALLFVATAFPADPKRVFWWDAIHHAVAACKHPAWLESQAGCSPGCWHADRRTVVRQLVRRFRAQPYAEAVEMLDEWLQAGATCPPGGQVLGWDELRRLQRDGTFLGIHTRTHPLLDRLTVEQAREEIAGAVDDARRELPNHANVFAYPGGACNDELTRLVASAGLTAAFTTIRGACSVAAADRWRLPRINVGRRATPGVLRVQLSLPPACLRWLGRVKV